MTTTEKLARALDNRDYTGRMRGARGQRRYNYWQRRAIRLEQKRNREVMRPLLDARYVWREESIA